MYMPGQHGTLPTSITSAPTAIRAATGFLDIIGQWKAENWEPDYLIRRYRKAGARYFMAMANHHDNLDLFDSKHHAWNSVRVGPKRDIVGTWETLVAADAGLKFGSLQPFSAMPGTGGRPPTAMTPKGR